MPEEYGGMGLDIKYAAVNWEEQLYTLCTGPGWALHSEICMPYILHYGSGMYLCTLQCVLLFSIVRSLLEITFYHFIQRK